MTDTRYELRYLPLFYDDLEEKILHIAELFEPYHSTKERRYPYYRIYVKNYVVYYVVIDDEGENKIMEVRRILHNKQKRSKWI